MHFIRYISTCLILFSYRFSSLPRARRKSQNVICHYFMPVNGLPDTRSSLSSNIASAKLEKLLKYWHRHPKARLLNKISSVQLMNHVIYHESIFGILIVLEPKLPDMHVSMGQCLLVPCFPELSLSSVNSMKKSYLKRLQEADSDKEVTTLPSNKHNWPYLLSDRVRAPTPTLLNKQGKQGTWSRWTVTASVGKAAARGIVLRYCSTQP